MSKALNSGIRCDFVNICSGEGGLEENAPRGDLKRLQHKKKHNSIHIGEDFYDDLNRF